MIEIGVGVRHCAGIAERAVAIEAMGFDWLHCGEHVFFHGPTPNAIVALSVAAGATSRVKLLSAITLLPLYPAAQLAKMASVLDIASGGRFSLGIGVGGEFPPEWDAVGVPHAERGARTDEGLEVLRLLFSGDRVRYDGRWTTIDGLGLQPPPTTPGGPPIWVAGRREAAQRRAGRFGDTWMPHLCTPEQLSSGLAVVRDAAAEAGRPEGAVDAAVYAWLMVDRDGNRARRIARETVGEVYRQDFSGRDRYLIAGTPDECVARIREFGAAGASAVQLTIASPEDEEPEVLSLLASDVVPALRA